MGRFAQAAWVLGLVAATEASAETRAPVPLTTGWVTVLDEPGAEEAVSADGSIALGSIVEPGQVLLVGVTPGETVISIWIRTGTERRRVEFPMSVNRFDSWVEPAVVLKVNAGQGRSLRVPGLRRVISGEASICGAVASGPDALELTPRNAGRTSLVLWAGGTDAAHRREVLVTVVSEGVERSTDDEVAVLTEPLDGRLVLVEGERLTLDGSRADRVEVRDSKVAGVRVGPGRVLILEGRAAGATRLVLWNGAHPPESRFVVVEARSRWEEENDDERVPPAPRAPEVIDRSSARR